MISQRNRDELLLIPLYHLMDLAGMDWEELFMILSRRMLADARAIDDPLVKSCVESCAEHLSSASMDYYVSTK
jgi:hypothetical protein